MHYCCDYAFSNRTVFLFYQITHHPNSLDLRRCSRGDCSQCPSTCSVDRQLCESGICVIVATPKFADQEKLVNRVANAVELYHSA